MQFTVDTIFLWIVSIRLDLLGQKLKTLNLYISATKHDRDMRFSGMESVIGGEYIWMENSQNENQHQMTKIKHRSLL